MSDASDIAREAADITLRGTDLTELATLRNTERKADGTDSPELSVYHAFNSSCCCWACLA